MDADEQSEATESKYVPSLNPEFGDARGFWNRYEDLAGGKDRQLSKDLNANLDNLLIFAGLFSAINTAFISFTMPSLSPDNFDRTNALLELILLKTDNGTFTRSSPSAPFSPNATTVVANCLLYASLCCSLLPAAGAMIAKEWLQNFDRKEVASLGDQARDHQKKVKAVETWYFRETIQLFPYTLLLSLVLFFAGLVPYLIGINKAVAGVVIAFIACGVSFWTVTILSCVLDCHSPYQTVLAYPIQKLLQREDLRERGSKEVALGPGATHPESSNTYVLISQRPPSAPLFLRRITIRDRDNVTLFNPGPNHDENGPGPLLVPADSAAGTLPPTSGETQPRNEDEKHTLNAETVNWFLGITSKPEDLLIVAQNLCCLEFGARKVILDDKVSWRRLLYFAFDALQRWRDRPAGWKNKLTAEFLGAALCHLLIDEPRTGEKWEEVRRQFQEKFFQSSTGRLSVLKSVLIGINEINPIYHYELQDAEYDLRKVFLQTQILEKKGEKWSILVGAIGGEHDDVILNLLAVLISTRSGKVRSTSDLPELAIKAYNGEDLVHHLADALIQHNGVFPTTKDPKQLHALLKIYVALTERVRNYCQPKRGEVDPQSVEKLRQPLPQFILGLTKLVNLRKDCSLTWIRLVMKAVEVIWAFKIDKTSRDAMYTALRHIISRSEACELRMDPFNLLQFTLSALKAIARDNSDLPAESLGDSAEIVPYLITVSTADGPDKRVWLTYFAKYPSIWMPKMSYANKIWKKSLFIPKLLEAFEAAKDDEEQEELASIMVHIARSKPSDWYTQLISASDGLAQVVEKSISSGGEASIPLLIALRPFLEVFNGPKNKIDWGTDQMYGIVGKLSTAIVAKDSGLLRRLGEQDSEVDIATLIEFIEHVKDRRTYEGSDLATIEQALNCLSDIPIQMVEKSISSRDSTRIPVVIALRPLLEVFNRPRQAIDWGTDLMSGIVGKLSTTIVEDSGLLRRLGEQDSEVDIATLIEFIEHVKGRRTYEGSDLATIEQALNCLSNIPIQMVKKSMSSGGSAPIPVVIALRQLLEVFNGPKDKIDWDTDLMYGIVGELSTAIVAKDSGLLRRLGEQDSGLDIATLIEFIKHVKDCRTYESSNLAPTIKQALNCLSGIHLAQAVDKSISSGSSTRIPITIALRPLLEVFNKHRHTIDPWGTDLMYGIVGELSTDIVAEDSELDLLQSLGEQDSGVDIATLIEFIKHVNGRRTYEGSNLAPIVEQALNCLSGIHLAQAVDKCISSGGSAPIPVVIALRQFFEVFNGPKDKIDWDTDLMYGIVGKLSTAIVAEDSGLLRRLGEQDSEVDIAILIEFIEHVKGHRTYERSKLGEIEQALNCLSGILAQKVEEKISSGGSDPTPVFNALRPLLKVFNRTKHTIDWGTDLMHGIVGKLSTAIVAKDSGLLQCLGEQDRGADIATLIKLIEHVKGRPTYEGSSLAIIELALKSLSGIRRSE